MKKIIFIILLLPFYLALGQNYFSTIIQRDSFAEFYMDVLELKSSYYTCGRATDDGTTISLMYTKFDQNGDTIFQKFWYKDSSEVYEGKRILKETDSTLLIFGTHSIAAGFYDPFIVKIDTNGNVLKDTVFALPKDNVLYDAIKLEESGYILSYTSNEINSNYATPHLIRLKADLSIDWESRYGLNNVDDWSGGIVECNDGSFLVAGARLNSSVELQNYLFKVDSLGVFLWDTVWGQSSFSYGVANIKKNGDNTFIFENRKRINANTFEINLYSFDENGNSIWNKDYIIPEEASISENILFNDDKTIIFQGVSSNNNNYVQPFILKTTPRGDTLWTRNYNENPNEHNNVWGMTPSSFGGYVFAGSTRLTGLSQDVWIKKIDCMGCDSVLCYYPDSCYIYDCKEDYPPVAEFTLAEDTIYYQGDVTIKFKNSSSDCAGYTWFINADSFNLVNPSYTFTQPGDYEITLVGRNVTCIDTARATLHLIDVTAIPELGAAQWVVYPNPFNETITIKFEQNLSNNIQINIIDVLGRKQQITEQIREQEVIINTSQLEKGIYILEVEGAGRTKVVKE